MVIKETGGISFDLVSRVSILDVMSADIGKIGQISPTVDYVLAIPELSVHDCLVRKRNHAASDCEVLDETITERTVSWHVDAYTRACRFAKRLHV